MYHKEAIEETTSFTNSLVSHLQTISGIFAKLVDLRHQVFEVDKTKEKGEKDKKGKNPRKKKRKKGKEKAKRWEKKKEGKNVLSFSFL